SVTDTATKSVSLDIRTPPQTAHSVPLPLDALQWEDTVHYRGAASVCLDSLERTAQRTAVSSSAQHSQMTQSPLPVNPHSQCTS
ncbi:hypothetical protein GBAR_LOCUS11549, partial [Geodia barretti]